MKVKVSQSSFIIYFLHLIRTLSCAELDAAVLISKEKACGLIERNNKCDCGIDKEQGDGRYIHPWSVEVTLTYETNKTQTCIGTIVASNVIITSHLCVIYGTKNVGGGYLYPYRREMKLVKDVSWISINGWGRKHPPIIPKEIIADPRFYRDYFIGAPKNDIAAIIVDNDFSDPASKLVPICIGEPNLDSSVNILVTTNDGALQPSAFGLMDLDECNRNIGYDDKSSSRKNVRCMRMLAGWDSWLKEGNPLIWYSESGGVKRYFIVSASMGFWKKGDYGYLYFPEMAYVRARLYIIFMKAFKHFPVLCSAGNVLDKLYSNHVEEEDLTGPRRRIIDRLFETCGIRDSKHRCQCGVDNRNHQNSIVRPWTVQVKVATGNAVRECVGTIVASNVVLTSHKCILSTHPYPQFSDGIKLPYKGNKMPGATIVDVKKITVHLLRGSTQTFKPILVIGDPRFYRDEWIGAPAIDIAGLVLDVDFTSPSYDHWPICIPEKKQYPFKFFSNVLVTTSNYITQEERFTRRYFTDCNEGRNLKEDSQPIWCAEIPRKWEYSIGEGTPILAREIFDPNDLYRYYYLGAGIQHYYDKDDKAKTWMYWADLDHTIERINEIFMIVYNTKPTLCRNKLEPWAFLGGLEKDAEEKLKRNATLDCTCGKEQPKDPKTRDFITPRIVGGLNASLRQYPWTARIYVKKPNVNELYNCGASIISDRVVLTAAHCVTAYNDFFGIHPSIEANKYNLGTSIVRIYFGSHNISMWDGMSCDDCVEKVIIHPGFFDRRRFMGFDEWAYDMALIILTEKWRLRFEEKDGRYLYSPVCLPEWRGRDIFGEKATIVGWGQTNKNDTHPLFPSVLQTQSTTILRTSDCLRGTSWKLFPNTICLAMSSRRGIGKGDSGGPATIIDGKHVLVGVSSFYYRYNVSYEPSFYINVVETVQFIDYYSNMYGAKYCK